MTAMTLGTLAAIRAIVAVHATYNRDRLLAHLDAAIERERASQPLPVQLTEEESMVGQVQIKTAPGAALVTPSIPEGLAINELVRSSDD